MSDLVERQANIQGLRRSAVFSGCGLFRYTLSRIWTPRGEYDWQKVLVVIGLNPSTATEIDDDPTIRRCIGYAKRWGYQGYTMLNLFAYRATDPKEMLARLARGEDIVGPCQDEVLANATAGQRVLCAWGAHGNILNRGREVTNRLRILGRNLMAFGTTKSGEPRHPLYLKADLLPDPYDIRPWNT